MKTACGAENRSQDPFYGKTVRFCPVGVAGHPALPGRPEQVHMAHQYQTLVWPDQAHIFLVSVAQPHTGAEKQQQTQVGSSSVCRDNRAAGQAHPVPTMLGSAANMHRKCWVATAES